MSVRRVGVARLRAADVDYEPPSHAPFNCGHCRWFDPGGGKGKGDEAGDENEPKGPHCEHPKILDAPVEFGGCCKRFNETDEEAKR
jgi:hypothetical protein